MEKVFYIDLKNITTKEALQQAIAAELPLPDYYGNNLDALYDVLTEEGDGWNIIFYNASSYTRDDSSNSGKELSTSADEANEFTKYIERLEKMCRQAVTECDNLQIRFYP